MQTPQQKQFHRLCSKWCCWKAILKSTVSGYLPPVVSSFTNNSTILLLCNIIVEAAQSFLHFRKCWPIINTERRGRKMFLEVSMLLFLCN